MKHKNLISLVLGSVAVVALSPAHAHAEEKSGGASQGLSAAGGIVSPGGSTAVFRNSAGLVHNPNFGVTVQAGAADSFNNPFLRAGLIGGGANFKVAGGLTQSTSNPSSTSLFYGVGVKAGSEFSIGLSGQTGISNAGGTTINSGFLYSGSLPFRLGATIMGISDGINEWGVGIASKTGSPVEFLLDGAYSSASDSVGLKPGIKVGNEDAALTLSYGFADAERTIQLTEGFTAGAGFKIKSSTLQIYYNDFATFYAAVTIGI